MEVIIQKMYVHILCYLKILQYSIFQMKFVGFGASVLFQILDFGINSDGIPRVNEGVWSAGGDSVLGRFYQGTRFPGFPVQRDGN